MSGTRRRQLSVERRPSRYSENGVYRIVYEYTINGAGRVKNILDDSFPGVFRTEIPSTFLFREYLSILENFDLSTVNIVRYKRLTLRAKYVKQ